MIYRSGDDAIPKPGLWSTVPLEQMRAGDNILQYHSPAIVYKVLSPSFIKEMLDGWVFFKNEYTLDNGGNLLRVLGMAIDTDSGEVWIRVSVSPIPAHKNTIVVDGVEQEVLESGINPKAVIAIGGALLAGLSVVLLSIGYVYEQKADIAKADANAEAIRRGLPPPYPNGGGEIDPCTQSGLYAEARCAIKRTSWLVLGAGLGIAILVIFMIARKEAV